MTRTNREVWISLSVFLPLLSTQSERAVWRCVIRSCSLSLRAHNKCVYGTSVCVHSHDGSGAVIVSSRKIGFVNFGVSRESGGAVRAPRNAGDKRVKRKRGSRSVAAIAARIERGYLKRRRTVRKQPCRLKRNRNRWQWPSSS